MRLRDLANGGDGFQSMRMMRLAISSWGIGLLFAGLITYTYSSHQPLSVIVSIPLLFPAGMLYPEHYDLLFKALMVFFGSIFYGFWILIFALFVREIDRATRNKNEP